MAFLSFYGSRMKRAITLGWINFIRFDTNILTTKYLLFIRFYPEVLKTVWLWMDSGDYETFSAFYFSEFGLMKEFNILLVMIVRNVLAPAKYYR